VDEEVDDSAPLAYFSCPGGAPRVKGYATQGSQLSEIALTDKFAQLPRVTPFVKVVSLNEKS
jgi:hypothetical protein